MAPPPEGVAALAAEDWDRFTAENGFVPPADYRALVDRYGVGGFGYYESTGPWLTMLHPVGAGSTFVEQSAWPRSLNTGFQRQFPDQEPDWPMWPEAGGFLPWGDSIDGDQIGWITAGDPDSWQTGVYGKGEHSRFPYGCVEFLYRWFTGCTGLERHDNAAARDLAQGSLRFFPPRPPEESTAVPARTEVTVVLAGIGAGAEARPEPSARSIFEPGISMTERVERKDAYSAALDRNQSDAVVIVDRWTGAAANAGVTVRSYGRARRAPDDALHWEIAMDFPPALEESAKALVVKLAHELGVAVRECRSLEYDLVWDDVVRRTA